jgi:FkbM family methyltransferase
VLVLFQTLQFLRQSLFETLACASVLWLRAFPDVAFPVRLPFGVWWLVRKDYTGTIVRQGRFENAEFAFVKRFLCPGMTVLDLGAHHGIYTLLASKCIGPTGKVISFEPSPRERQALLQHTRLNRCRNVLVEGLALGAEAGEADLFVVEGTQTGCNSLRPPASDVPPIWSPVRVSVVRLDDWLEEKKIGSIDFVKIDVEGGELDVLRGAQALLTRRPRPVFLIEVQDMRTLQWGYEATEIVAHLTMNEFTWFALTPDGSTREFDVNALQFAGNFVAWPKERELKVRF